MVEVRFPKRRPDGSFVLIARFATSDSELGHLLGDYVAAWVSANATWIRIWRSNSIVEERLSFASEFSSPPQVENGADGSSLSIRLEVLPSATRWKDWAVYLVDDVLRVFPELKFERFDS